MCRCTFACGVMANAGGRQCWFGRSGRVSRGWQGCSEAGIQPCPARASFHVWGRRGNLRSHRAQLALQARQGKPVSGGMTWQAITMRILRMRRLVEGIAINVWDCKGGA